MEVCGAIQSRGPWAPLLLHPRRRVRGRPCPSSLVPWRPPRTGRRAHRPREPYGRVPNLQSPDRQRLGRRRMAGGSQHRQRSAPQRAPVHRALTRPVTRPRRHPPRQPPGVARSVSTLARVGHNRGGGVLRLDAQPRRLDRLRDRASKGGGQLRAQERGVVARIVDVRRSGGRALCRYRRPRMAPARFAASQGAAFVVLPSNFEVPRGYPRGLSSSIALCISCLASSSCSRMSAMSILGLPGTRSLLQ